MKIATAIFIRGGGERAGCGMERRQRKRQRFSFAGGRESRLWNGKKAEEATAIFIRGGGERAGCGMERRQRKRQRFSFFPSPA